MGQYAVLLLMCVGCHIRAAPVQEQAYFSLMSCHTRNCIFTGYPCNPHTYNHRCCVGFCNEETKICDKIRCLLKDEICDHEVFDPVCCSGRPCPLLTGRCD